MPIYEYECRKCKAHHEVMQKVSDKPLAKCPKCGGQLEKQWSNTSFQLKGSGWYVTDYAGKKAESTKAESTSESNAGDSKKTDAASEPAAKEGKESAKETTTVEKEKPAAQKTKTTKPTASSGSTGD